MTEEPRIMHHATCAVRFGRYNASIGVALGRYWTWGGRMGRRHMSLRLPFLNLSLVRIGVPRSRVRVTYMGWRGIDHRPRPGFREWRFGAIQ
jgi:hypothetical protein